MWTMSKSDAEDQSLDSEDSPENGGAPSESEVRLVHAARNGDNDAFGELVQRYERRVLKVIRRFIPDLEMATDLVQESFLRAFERMDQFDPSRRFGPWLFRLAVNLTYDHLRKVRRRGRWSLFTDAGEDRAPDPAVVDPRKNLDLSQEVQVVLAEIPEAYRTVLILHEFEDLEYKEIAKRMECSIGTVMSRLFYARRKMANLMASYKREEMG